MPKLPVQEAPEIDRNALNAGLTEALLEFPSENDLVAREMPPCPDGSSPEARGGCASHSAVPIECTAFTSVEAMNQSPSTAAAPAEGKGRYREFVRMLAGLLDKSLGPATP
jgi:hypothetical protein